MSKTLFGNPFGCEWDSSSLTCTQPASNCNIIAGTSYTEESCGADGNALKGCFWEEAGKCTPHEGAVCAGSDSEFYTCTNGAWDELIKAVLSAINIADPSTWWQGDLIDDFKDKMVTGCFGKYRECIFKSECGNPDVWSGVGITSCKETMQWLCDKKSSAFDETNPNPDCPLNWCEIGVTQGKSFIDMAFEFAEDFDWTDLRVIEFRETIEMISGGALKLDWIEFDKNTGKVSITIPENEIVSQAQIDDIIKKFEEMLSSGSAQKGLLEDESKGFAMKTVQVTKKEVAIIDNSKATWEKEANGSSSGVRVGAAATIAGVAIAAMLM